MKTKPAPQLEARNRFYDFLTQDVVAAGLLLFSALTAVIVANSPAGDWYHDLWETHAGIRFENFEFMQSLHHWVNDGLMAIFFFLAGLEIKREMLVGQLASFRKALLPALAALGGMIFPALIYAAFNGRLDSAGGWGIPMATDIAFAMGCIALLSGRVPAAASAFLVALAIVDDIGAVVVIAVFYTERIAFEPLLAGSILIGISALLAYLGVRRTMPYAIIGILTWLAFLASGVHATVAGVLLAFTIPAAARYETELFEGRMKELLQRFHDADDHPSPYMVSHRQQDLLRAILVECHHVEAPLQRLAHILHPVCLLVIMPLFAFANSGLHLDLAHLGSLLFQPVTLGAFLGLVVGKQIGVMLFSWGPVRLGWADLPEGLKWKHVYGLSWLAGIGFTMALFVNELAFSGRASGTPPAIEHLDQARVGIFLASITAGTVGVLYLRRVSRTDAS